MNLKHEIRCIINCEDGTLIENPTLNQRLDWGTTEELADKIIEVVKKKLED